MSKRVSSSIGSPRGELRFLGGPDAKDFLCSFETGSNVVQSLALNFLSSRDWS